jgi:sugar O-acyltransferase (sialic acid O-acetyltransferase NeuD family)
MMPATPIIILGCGGTCIDVLDIIAAINDEADSARYEVLGFLDDDEALRGQSFGGFPVRGSLDSAPQYPDAVFANPLGSPGSYTRRLAITQKTNLPADRFETLIHPRATVSAMASIGRGSIVFPNVTVGSRANVGEQNVILAGCVINHDCALGDYTSVASGALLAGGVSVGKSCYIGSGCCIRGGVTIGDFAMVGMGAVVLEDVGPWTVVVGNPARILRRIAPPSQ